MALKRKIFSGSEICIFYFSSAILVYNAGISECLVLVKSEVLTQIHKL